MYQDKTLVCKECGAEFTFTAGEQEFYAEKGFENEPQRCKSCRSARKNGAKAEREMFEATCASCGGTARVPFRPREDRPVYCSDCFAKAEREMFEATCASCGGTARVPFRPREDRPVYCSDCFAKMKEE